VTSDEAGLLCRWSRLTLQAWVMTEGLVRMPQCRIVTTRSHRMLIFRIYGEVDLATVGAYRAELSHSVHCAVHDRGSEQASQDVPPWTMAVLDLRELAFLSAAGLRMLADLADTLAAEGVATGIAAEPGSLTHRLLYLAGLDRQAAVLDAVERATSTPG
jgi:anti-anti-sigma regulatory factor